MPARERELAARRVILLQAADRLEQAAAARVVEIPRGNGLLRQRQPGDDVLAQAAGGDPTKIMLLLTLLFIIVGDFIDATATLEIDERTVRVLFQKRAHNPLLLAAGFDKIDVRVPWWGKRVQFVFG